MATDVERLAVVIEAQTRQFERKITQLERQMDGSMRRSATSVGRLDRSFRTAAASAATFMRSFAVGAAAAAFTGLPVAINRAVSATADLGNAANRAGVSAEGLQVYRRALEQNGGAARDADDAMRRLTRRMGEFANSGAGPAKAAIEGLGLEVFDLEGNLLSSDAIMRQVAERFGQIENPAIAAAYAAQLFGDDAGPRLVPLLMQGERALDSFEAQLRDANALMSNDSVQAAIAMDDAYNRLIDNMGLRWMGFVVNTVQSVQEFVGTIQDAAAALNDLFESSQSPQERLQSALASRERGWSVRGDSAFAGYFDRSSFNMPSTGSTAEIVDPRQAQAMRELQGQLASTEETTRRVTQAFGLFGTTAEQSARTAGSALREGAGKAMEEFDGQIENANDNIRSWQQTFGGVFETFTSDIAAGASAMDALKSAGLSALGSISSKLIDMATQNLFASAFGSSGKSGMLGGLLSFIPGFASGTNSAPGGLAMVGERGPELVNLPRGSQVIPNHALAAGSNRQSQDVNINMSIALNGSVSRAEMAQMGQAIVAQANAAASGIALKTVTTTNRRAPGSLG